MNKHHFMKKLILILFNIIGLLYSHAQQIIYLDSGKLEKELASTVPTRNIEKLKDGYLLTYSFEKALIIPDILFSGTFFWRMDGFGMNETPGNPCTLIRNDMIAVPSGYNVEICVTDSIYHEFAYELTPARQPLLDSSNEQHTKQNVLAIEPYDGFKPAKVVSLSGIQSYRGHDMCLATVSPIQYNYNTKTVRAYISISYKVSFIPKQADVTTSKAVPIHLCHEDNFLANNVIGAFQEDTNKSASTAQADSQDYLILSTNSYATAANKFADWKRLMGYNVHVILRDDWTSASVKSTVSDMYANLPALYYLLIIGDHSDVPAQQSTLIRPHITDFHYGCIDNDYIPEIYCGRLSVSSSAEAINVVDKIIGYEQMPPTNPDFYSNGLHCAYFQDYDNYDSYADRRFAQTSEDIRTYVMSQGKSIQRVYKTLQSVTPLYWNNTYYSYGEPIPNELKKPGFAWNGNYSNINNAINNGVFYVLHRDHGAVTGWGDPQYTQQNLDSLSNGGLLPVVFSMNCLTGKFDNYCFTESFLRKSSSGCVAIYGASETSYSGYNDALTVGMFDAIWPNPGLCINIPYSNNSFSTTPTPTYTLGQILSQGMVRMAETYGANDSYTKYTKELFHCFGDPSMRIYTSAPTAFSDVSIVRNANSISVSHGSSETARMTVYDPVSGEVQCYLGNSATIPIPNPLEAIVCISAHNRIPFIQYPDIMYIQNTNVSGTLNETHDVIKVGNHVTNTIATGDVTTSNADITLRAKNVLLDSGTYISVGTTLKIVNP